MADATISMVLKKLAPLIGKKVKEEVLVLLNAKNEAESLASKLEKIHGVLVDAERKGVTDPRVKSWLDKLQEIAYEIEDVLDEWEILESLKLEEESEDASTSRGQPRQKFIPNIGGGVSRDFKRIESTSFVEVSEVRGRDSEKKRLMSKLLSESSSQGEDKIKIISIVGAGGMGKTTLAQFVFHEIKKQNHEFKPIWVCVSHPFEEIKIAKTILDSLKVSYPPDPQFETLLNSIEDSISGKRFFLVLDDVWTEDNTMWKPLKKSLVSGEAGSRILVTTRNEKVAKVMGSSDMDIHSLHPLSDSDCWSILSQIAFQNRRDSNLERLQEIGLEIAKKCKGMPLAAKTMGGLLRFKSGLQEWQNVLESKMWEETVKEEVDRGQNIHHLNLMQFGDGIDFSLYPKLRSLFCGNLAISPNFFRHLKRVRLLIFENLKEIPNEIGDLIHLRYLDVSENSSLKELSETVCNLYNLQTLGIRGCGSLCGLPEGIHKLKNLRHLLNRGTAEDFKYPQGFEKLTNLRTLDRYHSNKWGYLKDMIHLQGFLSIEVRDGMDEDEVKKADLKNKISLQSLRIHVEKDELFEIIEDISPPPNLEGLNFGGRRLPKWCTTLTQLRILTFNGRYINNYSWSFPPLGKLPFLEELSITGVPTMHDVGHDLLGMNYKTSVPSPIFPKLKELQFSDCKRWKEWEDISEEEEENNMISIMPCLQVLQIDNCPELKALPHRLLRKASSLQVLKIISCPSLKDRYNRETGEDWDKVSHISKVEIHRTPQ
ncbi:hypothetical protein BUALT_Bualt14G0097700 [Buddleja alternifolia]|uniref:Uncharacterized protein n=1 Tax=Buddleja alternifolia TaxID=168488 RepID=A0AAV6WTL0_9LAMI|nr:hypothetical protein BUALT_Bualt14G0097700 [Buddleja alternifolia]